MEHPNQILSEAKAQEDALDQLCEDDLGRMIRWGLQDSFSGAEPPDDVWPKILSRVQEMRAAAGRPQSRRRPSFSLAPLFQAVVVSALLVTFSLGVDRNVTAPRGERTTHSTPTVPKIHASEELPNDMLSGFLLARMEKQPPTPQRPGGLRP